jgi:hypothetical protein
MYDVYWLKDADGEKIPGIHFQDKKQAMTILEKVNETKYSNSNQKENQTMYNIQASYQLISVGTQGGICMQAKGDYLGRVH